MVIIEIEYINILIYGYNKMVRYIYEHENNQIVSAALFTE